MKKIFKISLLTIVLTIIFGINHNIKAASCGISATSATAYVGDQVNININISGAATWNVHISGSGISDSIVGYEPNGNNTNTKKSYSLNTSKVGTYEVFISGDITSADGTNQNVSGKTSVTIKERPTQTNTNTIKNVDTRSSNNYLSSLNIEGYELSPAFNANTNNYTINVKSDVKEINISAIPADTKSKTIVSGNLDLVVGENNVTVTVIAENGYKRVYTITVIKDKDPDDIDATIEFLTIKNAILKNEFKSDVYEYMCEDITADINKLDIELQTKIAGIKYEITGNDELKQGINHITIKVTSRDGSETKEYKIIVFKTDEVLALEDVESVIANTPNTTFFDKIKSVKYELIVIVSLLLLLIIVIVSIFVVRKKKLKNNNNFIEETLDNEIEPSKEVDHDEIQDEIIENEITDKNEIQNVEQEDSDEKVEVEEVKVRKGRTVEGKKHKSKKIKLDDNLETIEEIDVTLDLPDLDDSEDEK